MRADHEGSGGGGRRGRAAVAAALLGLTVVGMPRSAATQPRRLGERVERDGVSVTFFAGAEVRDVASDAWRATVQRTGDGDVIAGVFRSEDYRERRDAGERRRVLVCDVMAELVVIEGHHLDGEPMTESRVELEHRGLPIWISWRVRRDRRAAYSAREQEFFRSIRCTAGPMLGVPVGRFDVDVPFLRGVPIDDRTSGVARQRIAEADIVITVETGASPHVPDERFLLRVCQGYVDYASHTRGDRTVSEVRVPRGRAAVRVAWSVPTENRDAWRWLEDSFFAATACPP